MTAQAGRPPTMVFPFYGSQHAPSIRSIPKRSLSELAAWDSSAPDGRNPTAPPEPATESLKNHERYFKSIFPAHDKLAEIIE